MSSYKYNHGRGYLFNSCVEVALRSPGGREEIAQCLLTRSLKTDSGLLPFPDCFVERPIAAAEWTIILPWKELGLPTDPSSHHLQIDPDSPLLPAANMVKFESKKTSDGLFLTVKDDNDREKTLIVPIFSSMTGAFADKWKIDHYPPHLKKWVSGKSPKAILNSSHHHEKDTTRLLSLLYDRISLREVTWSSKPQFGMTFLHIPLYWEWTEDIIRRCKTTLMKTDLIDAVYASMFLYKCNSPLMQRFCEFWCPTKNTVLTGDGEASISLWDLRILGGLPIHGAFYDEVVPTALELEGSQDGEQFLPASCKYMFTALQSIMSTSRRSHVTFEEWCRFWFRAPKRYSATILPKAVENFSHFGIPESWSNKHEALTLLNVPEEHHQQTYLAAFLSCWLYAFVFPLKDLGCIRPSVFKPASQLASGQRISLAIPVLASIYRGLNEISHSLTPGRSYSNFPAHYVHAWTAQYFRSHCMSVHDFAGAQMIAFHGASNVEKLTSAEAKVFICSGQDINWIGNCMRNPKDRLLIDDSTLRQDVDFLLSIRSCFLTLRYDNDHVVEPYSPHSTQVGTKSSFIIPACGMNNEIRSRTNAPFKLWWKTSYSSPEPSPSPPLVISSRKRKVDNDNDTKADSCDKGESKLQKSFSQSSRDHLPNEERRVKKRPLASSPMRGPYSTTFLGDQTEDDFDYVKELEIMGNAFAFNNPNAKELEHTTASIDPNVLVAASDPIAMYAAATIIARGPEVVNESSAISMEAPSFTARVMISAADRCAARFLAQQMRAKLLQTPLSNIPALDPELKELFGYITSKNIDVTNVKSRLSDVVNSKRKEEEQIKLQQAEILKIEQRCDELQKELKLLEQKSELSSALASSEDSLGKHDAAVTELTVSHSSIEEEITATREAATKRKKAEENFQNARTALESLHWEP
ncbi:Huntingtin-interacting protein 1-related protein [Bienertia sinuspersici]